MKSNWVRRKKQLTDALIGVVNSGVDNSLHAMSGSLGSDAEFLNIHADYDEKNSCELSMHVSSDMCEQQSQDQPVHSFSLNSFIISILCY